MFKRKILLTFHVKNMDYGNRYFKNINNSCLSMQTLLNCG